MQVFELTFYRVAIQGNDYSEIIYEGINFDYAKMEYDSVNISDFQDDFGGVVELEKFDRLYEYIYDLEDLEDFPFLKHYADNSLFKEIDETEIETLFQRRVDYINQQSDELLSRVQQHYFQIYGDYKYNNIPVTNGLPEDDDDFIEFGCIQLRLADHSENLQNVDRFGVCDYYISVVIADKNATKEQFFSSKFERRKNEVELYFDSDSNFDEIIDEIEDRIENARELIMPKYEQNNQMKMGGKLNPSKTPAPIKERVYGSKINKPESSASLRSASAIKLSSENISTLNKKVLEFKSKYINRNKRMTLNALKAVMRRGMGAYSSTHRPTISGGKPNSRVAWGLARVNAFLFKAENGRPKNPKYVQDDDLLRELGYKFAMQMGGGVYLPELYDFDESELKKGGEISPEKFKMPNKEVLEYGDFLKKNHPKVWKAGGNIFGNQAFENLKRVSNRGYWLESERGMYEKWQSFVKRHQHNHLLAGIIANVKWASWGNIGKAKAKSVIENAFSDN